MKTAVLLALFALCNLADARVLPIRRINAKGEEEPLRVSASLGGGSGGRSGGGQKEELGGFEVTLNGKPFLLPDQIAALNAFKTVTAGIPGIANFIGGSDGGSDGSDIVAVSVDGSSVVRLSGGKNGGFYVLQPVQRANTNGRGSGGNQKGFIVLKRADINRIIKAGGGLLGDDADLADDADVDEENAGGFRTNSFK